MCGAFSTHIHSHSLVEICQSGIELSLGKTVIQSYQPVAYLDSLIVTFKIEQNSRLCQ